LSTPAIRVLLIEDHEIVREGLSLILQRSPDLAVVGTAADGESGVSLALRLAERDALDVIVTDLGLPGIGGLEVIQRVKARFPHIRILILSMYTDDEHIRGMLASGADGYLLKQSSVQELPTAIRTVARGETALAPLIARRMMTQMQQAHNQVDRGVERLTEREREVLQLMAVGETTKAIARRYGCQPKTVENHRGRILAKLGVNNTPAAITLGFQRGLISATST
jgi:DNA-binding NarL/FixJ family response regulator